MIRSFDDLREAARQGPSRGLAVAGGEAEEVATAVYRLIDKQLISHAVITGRADALRKLYQDRKSDKIQFAEAKDASTCALKAVAEVRSGACDVLMKGHIGSSDYLRAVLDRDAGLRAGNILSNVTVAEIPGMDRLLCATDNGIIADPDLDQKRQIVSNTAKLFRGLGLSPIRVAAVCAAEKVTDRIQDTLDAAQLTRDCEDGKFFGFEIGGPMGYDVAVSELAAEVKGLLHTPAAGCADLLLFPNIVAANAVAKAWKFHGNAKTGSIVLGASAPVLLNSRSDSADRRINAFLLAMAVLKGARA